MTPRHPAPPLTTLEEGECLAALSLCVISLNAFWTALDDFEKKLGFKVDNLDALVLEDWRTIAPKATRDLRPLLHRILAGREETNHAKR
jgi:hypothetical protein